MILFRCSTFGHLLNAINIKMSLYSNEKADLILSALTDFSSLIERLRECQIFENVIVSNDSIEDNRLFASYDIETKKEIISNPETFLHTLDLKNEYNKYFTYSMVVYGQLIYYYLLNKGMEPTVHLYEEGLYNYVEDGSEREEFNSLSEEIYRNKAFMHRIVEQLLYEPNLYCGKKQLWRFTPIPKFDSDNKDLAEALRYVFGEVILPKERFILLEEAFVWDKIDARDMECFESIVQYIGKENVIVKLHPRNPIDRFSNRNYKVMEESNSPWEIYFFSKGIENKVFLTISSNASITAKLAFGKEIPVIQLYKCIGYGKNNAQRKSNYKNFLNKLVDFYNENEKIMFLPKTEEECKEVVKYVNGRFE